MQEKAEENIRWAHFSDLHVGSAHDHELWPRFKTLFFDDIRKAIHEGGPFDLIIFSGDMTNTGSKNEFSELTDRIQEVLEVFGKDQQTPKLIAVPGNHDLNRPNALQPEALALRQYWQNEDLRKAVWAEPENPYRALIKHAFANFSEWQSAAIVAGWHLEPHAKGFFPGDAAYGLHVGSKSLGVISLNSAWLQLGPEDYSGALDVDVKQLLALTGGDPDAWVRSNDVNIVVTHHPPEWLREKSLGSWRNDIAPSGRFDLHAFGHMHLPIGTTQAVGGGFFENRLQAASLFGLETFGDGEQQRLQGYSWIELRPEGSERTVEVWPRRLAPTAGKKLKVVPDNSQDIDEITRSYRFRYEVDGRSSELIEHAPLPKVEPTQKLAAPSTIDLEPLRYDLGDAGGHAKVRKLEQEEAAAFSIGERFLFLSSDWGMGRNGFLEKVRLDLGVSAQNVFLFDFAECRSRSEFIERFKATKGSSFESVCGSIAELGPSLIIFSDVNLLNFDASDLSEFLEFVRTLRDFIDEGVIVVHSRVPYTNEVPNQVVLRPLDEPDLVLYVKAHPKGNDRFARPDAAAILFRHTDGVPAKLDDALRDLEVISLRELISTDADYGPAQQGGGSFPPALVSGVDSLVKSEDRAEQRSYGLLQALSALPQGERLSRIRRFLGVHGFESTHAKILLARTLIESVVVPAYGMEDDVAERVLVVPRVVREVVRHRTSAEESKSIDRSALELYFGADWRTGEITSSPIGRRASNALCDAFEIENSSTLIIRSLLRAVDEENELDIEAFIRLSSAFVEILRSGDHFRAAAQLCEQAIQAISDVPAKEREREILRYQYGRALRMAGHRDDARKVLENLDHSLLSKEQRQSVELQLALVLERTEPENAAQAAARAIAIAPKSASALQARTVIAEAIQDLGERETELQKLLGEACKRENVIQANNIRFALANVAEARGVSSREIIRELIMEARKGKDFYNGARAIIRLANQENAENWMTERERGYLIESYHYLYNERIEILFNSCHDALWKMFVYDDNRESLLSLFRRSSFIWRLIGRDSKESRYLNDLIKLLTGSNVRPNLNATRDGAYFIVRVRVIGPLDEISGLLAG